MEHAEPVRPAPLFAGTFTRLLRWGEGRDGRLLLWSGVALYLALVTGFELLGGWSLWSRLGVPSAPSLFFDARNIASAAECARLDLDPLVSNPCDPTERPLNYPRVWLALRWLGMNQSWTFALGVIVALAFLVSLSAMVGRLTLGQGVVLTLAVWSPAVMFGLERGQSDLVVFAVLALAVMMWRSDQRRSILAPLVVLAAAVLKIFPVFALGGFLFSRHRKAALMAIVAAFLFVGYAAATLGDLSSMAAALPQGQHYSYGARILLAPLYHRLVAETWAGSAATKQLAAVTVVLVVALAAWWWSRRLQSGAAEQTAHEAIGWKMLAFHFGALIYLGTFAAANNWDYRLVFLLLTLPQLFAWTSDPAAPLRRPAGLALAVLLAVLYLGSIFAYRSLADELAGWALAALLVMLLLPSVRQVASLLGSAMARPSPAGKTRGAS